MTMVEILNEWESEAPLSEETIREAVRHQEEITPHLIEILERMTANAEHYARDTAYDGHMCALYLLAQFREPKACAAVANFCRIDPALLDDLIGDIITEELPQLLAAVCGGDTAPIRALIEDTAADEYARGSAIESLKLLALEGIVPRDEIMAYFKELFNTRLERKKFDTVRAELVCEAVDLYPGEVEEEIREAYREQLLDDGYIPLQDVENALEKGMDFCLQRTARDHKDLLVFDAPTEVIAWQRDMQQWSDLDDYEEERPFTVLDEMQYHDMRPQRDNTPYRREGIKAGPNDPCPCGSAKKFKKCCGRMDSNPPASQL